MGSNRTIVFNLNTLEIENIPKTNHNEDEEKEEKEKQKL